VSDPARPEAVAAVGDLRARGVDVVPAETGDAIVLVAAEEGLAVVHIAAEDLHVERIGSIEDIPLRHVSAVPGKALAAAVSGRGVEIIDIGDARSPHITGFVESPFAEDLWVSEDGSLIYVAEGHEGLSVLDLRDPSHPRKVSSCPGIYATGVAGVTGEDGERYAYVAGASHLRKIHVLIPQWLR